MTTTNRPSIDYVRQALRYEDGKLFWLSRPGDHFISKAYGAFWNRKFAGNEAGSLKNENRGRYRVCIVTLDDRRYRRSILNWVLIHGEWPSLFVDHKDRDTTNDKIDNLRQATRTQNHGNSKVRSDNTSGFKGVWPVGNRYRAKITVGQKDIHIGYFDTVQQAHEAYMKAAREYFGEFATDGK